MARRGTRSFSSEILLLGTVTAWSSAFTAVAFIISHGLPPLAYSAVRTALAAIAFAIIARRRERVVRLPRRDAAKIALAGFLGIAVNQVAFVYAVHRTGAATVALLFGAAPIFVALLAHFSRNEVLNTRHWTGAAISFSGVVLVVASYRGISMDPLGLLLGLLTAATWATYSIIAAPLLRHYSTSRLNAGITLFGSLPLLVVATPQLLQTTWSEISVSVWLATLYCAIVYVLGNTIWFLAIRRVGASHASLYTNLEPLLGALFAVLLLSEHLGVLQGLGGVLITVGIFLARRGPEIPPAE